ncbi:MAG: hypothetical protein HN764_02035 [Gammaproteobacteria bacterium]|nr:hypothetical protein [Gammaproteobacteria bacterium]
MNCEQIRELLDEFPLTEFSAQQLVAAEKHAGNCPECEKLLTTEKELESLLKKLPEPEASADLTAAVMTRIQQHDEKIKIVAQEPTPIQTSEWPISMVAAGIAITFCIYAYELFNGRSTTFNLYSLWTDGWQQWLFSPVQLNLVGLLIAGSFAFYLFGFFSMLRDREFSR